MAERLCEFESHLGHLRKFQVFEFQILGIFSFYFCPHFVSQISFFISELTQNSSQLADELSYMHGIPIYGLMQCKII